MLVLYFLHVKSEKNNQSPCGKKDKEFPCSCQKICKPRHRLQILDMRMEFPRPFQNVVMDYIILFKNVLFNK